MFNGFYITEKGREYIARSMVDRALVFTRGEFGNGELADGETPQAATKLKSPLGTMPISKKDTNLSTTTISTQFSNRVNGSLLPSFHLTEAGLYGKLKSSTGLDDPDNPETLLLYSVVPVDQSDYIQQILTEFVINWPLVISQAASVTVSIDDSLVYPTLDDYTKKIAQINEKLASVATSFVAEDVSLTSDMFSEDSTYKSFPYKAVIPLEGVTDQAVADVVFGPDEAEAGIFGSITVTQEGGVIIYARELPEDEEIIIPTIEIRYATGMDNTEDDDPIGDDVLDSDDVATDEEVGDIIDDIFDTETNPDPDTPGGDSGGDDNQGGDIATDEEVGDVIEDVFGDDTTTDTPGEDTGGEGEDTGGSGDDSGGSGSEDSGDDGTQDDNIATDEEVGDIIEDIFG